MSKRQKPPELISGSYTPIPHAVLDSVAFTGASVRAKAMLFELLRQHNGRNNGRFQLSSSWLKKRGWTSADQVQKAKSELLARGLIEKTRLGGLSIGPDWFALTWVIISDYDGLDIAPSSYHPGKWRFMDAPPTIQKREAQSATRNSTVPSPGIGQVHFVPLRGTIASDFDHSPIPPHGNNECCQLSRAKPRSRVVGKKGQSGHKSKISPAATANQPAEQSSAETTDTDD